ncbi:hypothetical protein LX36DRAFT_664610, partial [Colletotrichum falcatum]
ISKVERYHATLRRAYNIIQAETGVEPDVTLQLVVKAINNTTGLDGLVPTLLVFSVYPRITNNSPPSATITQRAETVKKAMEAVRQIHAKRQVNEALATRNGPNTSAATALPLQLKQGPFILLANNGTTCTVELPQGPRNFRITVVKPWHKDELKKQIKPTADTPANEPANGQPEEQLEEPQEEAYEAIIQPARQRLGRPRKHPPKVFVRVFHIVMFNERKHGGIRIFKSWLVREVKGKNKVPYKKSRLWIILAFTLSLIQLRILAIQLNRVILARLPVEIRHLYPLNAIMVPITFNGGVLSLKPNGNIYYRQKGQGKKLQPTNPDSTTAKQQYVKQQARGAYIASICQPEACFDYSQIANLNQGLRFTPLNLATAKLFVFVNSSFINNNNLTSQLGFIVVLANKQGNSEEDTTNSFTLTANVVYYSSTKCKRVTRSILASEIYAMVAGANITHAIGTTITMITNRLKMPPIPTILCTDSYSLYKCLVKLGTTKEKRLMIDIMALRQSYERREIYEIRWIQGDDNPADAFTKATPNKALEGLILTGRLNIRMNGWVSRT